MATPLPRPRQVLIAGWLIIVGSLLSLAGAFDQVQSLGSLQMAEEIESQLERPMFDGLSLTIDQVESWIKVLSIVGAVCATTMSILAWQVLQQRSTTARVWLTILAVPTFFTGMVGDSFFTTMVVVSVGLLWTLPARQWFAGTWKPEPVTASRPGQERRAPSARESFRDTTHQVTAPVHDKTPASGSQPPPMASWPPPSAAALEGTVTTAPAPTPPSPSATGPRPTAVMGAAILTWVFSAISAIAIVTVMTVTALDPAQIMDEMRRVNPEVMEQEEITEGVVQMMFVFLAGIVVVWTASACTLAALVVRRVAWARIVLVISAAIAALVLLVAAAAAPLMLAPFVAAAATVGLLLRRDVSAWLARR